MKFIGRWLLICSSIVMLAGCGKDEAGVSIFITDNVVDATNIREPLEKSIQEKVGEDLKVEISTAGIYNEQKILIEYAAREHEIVILPEGVTKVYAQQGTHIALDPYFDSATYPTGFFEGGVTNEDTDEVIQEKHLFAIPISEMKVFQDLGYTTEGMLATIPISTDSVEDSVKVLKAMIGE